MEKSLIALVVCGLIVELALRGGKLRLCSGKLTEKVGLVELGNHLSFLHH